MIFIDLRLTIVVSFEFVRKVLKILGSLLG